MRFFSQFIAHPRTIGAIAPSSKRLGKLIVQTAKVESKDSIVELGPGTGVFTEEIVRKVPKGSTFFSIELNPKLAKETKKRCPKAIVYNGSAENIDKYLKLHGLQKCDCVISSLPFKGFKKKFQEKLLNNITRALKKGGQFLTFSYVHTKMLPSTKSFEKFLKRKFSQVVKTKTIWKNLPPAFVYLCIK